MTKTPAENIIEITPVPGIYTVLMIIAILALWVGIAVSHSRLTSALPVSDAERGGYGLTVGEMFSPDNPDGVDK